MPFTSVLFGGKYLISLFISLIESDYYQVSKPKAHDGSSFSLALFLVSLLPFSGLLKAKS
jgi:hypothetical protein